MQRKIFVVTAAYGYEHIQAAGGQKALLPVIAKSGADGVEIRRELFTSTDLLALAELGLAIEHAGLQACYSAPEPLFIENGDLNPQLPQLLQEAKDLKSLWLKVSLGHFGRPDQLNTLRDWLASSDMALVVENDQTPCGRLQPMLRFKEICQQFELPVKLTFDMGNWLWVGDSPEEAAYQLVNSVGYIHVKAALPHKESFRAVPPDNADSRWLKLLTMLPADVPRGIEFPRKGLIWRP